MKRHCLATGIALTIALLAACTAGNGGKRTEDFRKDIYTPKYAAGFDIKGAEGMESTLITVYNPWQGADSVATRLLVARNGEAVPEGFEGQVVDGEAARIVTMSSTHIAMLEAFGESRRVVGVSGAEYIVSSDIQSRRDDIADVGLEGNISYELLVALDPSVVLLFGMGGASPMEGKLKELGIPYMYVGDYLEESPLGKAEWIVALAEVTGRRTEGIKTFEGIPERYNALKRKVEAHGGKAPKVMVNTPYADSWIMPPPKSYTARLIADAGGDYVYRKDTGNAMLPIDTEEAYRLTAEADLWINVGLANSIGEVKAMCPKLAECRCLQSGNVWNNNRRATAAGGNDFFESAAANPDLVLRDLIKIFHPQLVEEDFVYYKQLK